MKGGSIMKAKAAIFWEVGKRLDIQEVDVEKPHAGEVLVKLGAAEIVPRYRWIAHSQFCGRARKATGDMT